MVRKYAAEELKRCEASAGDGVLHHGKERVVQDDMPAPRFFVRDRREA